ncbi:MAG: twin-arginine translocase subunit TatC [Armatimonadetes bacterium]|nr:twin-arginine translocase subunit TatC [Armatimonadota bacterium]
MAAKTDRAKEMGFWDHVEELRQRLIRCALYIAVAAVAAWFFRTPMLAALEYPALEGARRAGLEDFSFRIFEAAGGLMLMVQIALVGGIVLASPLLTMELWGFLSPALHPHERRWVMWALPTATALFLSGVLTCYWIAPAAFAFFFRFNVSLGVQPELTLAPYLYFFMRLALVFGVLFELPLFLMILGAAGLISSGSLLRQWRPAVVGIFIVAAVATPTGDALTMTVLAAPMVVLYALSVVLVRMVEKKRVAVEEVGGEAVEKTAAAQAASKTLPSEAASAPAPEQVDIDELYSQIQQQQYLDR